MRALGNLLLTFALTVGALASASAYLAPLSLPAAKLVGLTLNAPAGFKIDPDTGVILHDEAGKPLPLADKGDALTEDLVAQLKAQAENASLVEHGRRVNRVLVQEFSLSRWPGKWFFLLAFAALIGGGLLVRKSASARIAAAAEKRKDGGSPTEVIDSARMVVTDLLPALLAMPDDELRCETIVDRIGQLQRNEMELFAEMREDLIGAVGLGGFARIMDAFASAERQINRAWSTAADGVCDESMASLDRAKRAFDETLERLRQP